MMTLEWLRRNHDTFASHIGTYVNTNVPILDAEEQQKQQGATFTSSSHTRADTSLALGIGSLRGAK
jgi:hypothetical protein